MQRQLKAQCVAYSHRKHPESFSFFLFQQSETCIFHEIFKRFSSVFAFPSFISLYFVSLLLIWVQLLFPSFTF